MNPDQFVSILCIRPATCQLLTFPPLPPTLRVQIGFQALRELAVLRPTVRDEAVDVLLSLTTHSGPYRLFA